MNFDSIASSEPKWERFNQFPNPLADILFIHNVPQHNPKVIKLSYIKYCIVCEKNVLLKNIIRFGRAGEKQRAGQGLIYYYFWGHQAITGEKVVEVERGGKREKVGITLNFLICGDSR